MLNARRGKRKGQCKVFPRETSPWWWHIHWVPTGTGWKQTDTCSTGRGRDFQSPLTLEVSQHRAAALLSIFAGNRVREGPLSALRGIPRQQEPLSRMVRVNSFPFPHRRLERGWRLCIALSPAPLALCCGGEGEGKGVICARRRVGTYYTFFETPVKTGINTQLPELLLGLTPALYSQYCEGFSLSLQK